MIMKAITATLPFFLTTDAFLATTTTCSRKIQIAEAIQGMNRINGFIRHPGRSHILSNSRKYVLSPLFSSSTTSSIEPSNSETSSDQSYDELLSDEYGSDDDEDKMIFSSSSSKEEEDDEEDDDDEKGGTQRSENSGDLAIVKEYNAWSEQIQKSLEQLLKKESSLKNELDKVKKIESLKSRAQLIVNNIYVFNDSTNGSNEYTVQDWDNDGKEVQIKLDTKKYDSPSDEADALFEQVRKLKRGSKIVSNLLEKTSSDIQLMEEMYEDFLSSSEYSNTSDCPKIDDGRLRLMQDRLIRFVNSKDIKFDAPKSIDADTSKSNKKATSSNNNKNKQPPLGHPSSNIRKFKTPNGCTVLVGRNKRGNEYLSLHVAKGTDLWMHSRGVPGAHVVIQHRRGSGLEITDDCLQFSANLAIFYSDSRNERKASVTIAEPKHLSKPKGAPLGAIRVREEKQVIIGMPDDVPEDVKLARDESGLTDEYHMKDKAKHRKRRKEVDLKVKERKRNEKRIKQRNKRQRQKYGSSEKLFGNE